MQQYDKMILAILQGDDYHDAVHSLNEHGFYATVLNSSGGFLKKRSVTLMIGLESARLDEALAILMYTPKAASEPVLKLLNSAVANAENNLGLSADNLYVAEVFANQGPTLKRFRPRAQGRATRIRKRTSHITIILDQMK